MTQEALRMALEKIATVNAMDYEYQAWAREALAQTQEPVAYWNFDSGFSHCMIDKLNEAAKHNPAPLYTTPPQRTWVDLTDEDISEIVRGTHNTGSFVRAIEAKLKQKNGYAYKEKNT